MIIHNEIEPFGMVARRAGIETWPIPDDCERSSRAEIRECDVCMVARTRDLREICLLSLVEAYSYNNGDPREICEYLHGLYDERSVIG